MYGSWEAYYAAREGDMEEAKDNVSSVDFFEDGSRKLCKWIRQWALSGAIDHVLFPNDFDNKCNSFQQVYYWIDKTNVFPVLLDKHERFRADRNYSDIMSNMLSQGVNLENILVKLEKYYKKTGFL